MNASTETEDGGPTVESILDAAYGDQDHFLRHVTDDEFTFAKRHSGHIRTDVEDGVLVHYVTEHVADEAAPESLSWNFRRSCPCDDHNSELVSEESVDDGAEDPLWVETWACEDDFCPFYVKRATRDAPIGDDAYGAPVWYRARIPVGCVDTDFDAEKWASTREDMGDDSDVSDVANIIRRISLRGRVHTFSDRAYIIPDDEDEDSYIDRAECGHCGRELDAPAMVSHAHYGEVCPDCEGVTVWSAEDANLPDDVRDRMADHSTFTAGAIRKVLRDVIYWSEYVAGVQDRKDDGGLFAIDDDDVDPEDVPPIQTGEQGRHSMGRGDRGKAGTGFRRPSGAAHNRKHWRTFVKDCWETGLIDRADSGDVDFDDPNARWTATEKGRRVFDELARCRTCGGHLAPFLRVSEVRVGRSTRLNYSLALACEDCDDHHSERAAGEIDSSGGWSFQTLPGVDYAED